MLNPKPTSEDQSVAIPGIECLTAQAFAAVERRETPIVFVHGAFVGAWCWEAHFLDYFAAQGFTVYAPSFRGHGGSDGEDRLDQSGIREYVADLARVIDAIPGPAPILVGHSMGARVVERYLERYPATAAILMAPIPTHGLMPSSLRLAIGDPMLFAQYAWMQTFGVGSSDLAIAERALFSNGLSPALRERYLARAQRESQRALWELSLPGGPRPSLVDNKPPMLVMAAGEDALFSVGEVHGVAKLWESDSVLIEGLAHALMLERQWQRVADELIRWIWQRGIH